MVQLVWKGSVFDHSGYSRACREYLLGLQNQNIDVKLDLISNNWPRLELPPQQVQFFNQLIGKPLDADQFNVLHQTPDLWVRKPGVTVGFTYWETSKIPDTWIGKANQMNGLFVSSEQNKEVFRQSGVNVPIYKIRPSLSHATLNPPNIQLPSYMHHQPSFKFLSIFEWIERKGYDLLLKAYFEEFSAHEDVVLIIKSHNAFVEENVRKERAKYPTPGRVFVDTAIRNDNEMAGMYKSCQAFVHASRGEGLGYPLLEAGAHGLPVIATGWGGHTDFLKEDNSFLIPYRLVPVNQQPYYSGYKPDQSWAEASVVELKRMMRHVFNNHEEAKQKAVRLQAFIREHYTPEKAATDLMLAVNELTRGKEAPSPQRTGTRSEQKIVTKFRHFYRKEEEEFIRNLYQQLYHREPIDHELTQSKRLLASGYSRAELIVFNIQSQEFSRSLKRKVPNHPEAPTTIRDNIASFYHVADPDYFVDQLYEEFLLRAPDEAGKKGYVNFVQNGGSRINVLASFLSSPEFSTLVSLSITEKS